MKIKNIKELNELYQEEIIEHDIEKRREKNKKKCKEKGRKCDKFREYDIQIKTGEQMKEALLDNKIDRDECESIKKGIDIYESELDKYDIFVWGKREDKLRKMIFDARDEHSKICDNK